MVIYNLEEDPNIYITPTHYGNRFVYRMATFVGNSLARRVIRNIDLRIDRLTIHGTEIKEPMLRRLYESLTLGVGPKMGHIYVNCNGACYIFVTGKGVCKPIYNTIFDWSAFEVIVPNSLSDSLRKKLKQKEREIEQANDVHQPSTATDEAKVEAANKNIEELEHQLLCCRKENEDLTTELRKLQDELSSTKDELISTKTKLVDSSEKKVIELKDYRDTKVELLEKVSDKLHSVNSKVKSTNQKLDQALVSQLWSHSNRDKLPDCSNQDDLPVYIAIEEVDE